MRTFIYGRPAVTEGDRGYRVFKANALETKETREIKELFSDQDPDIRGLEKEHFDPYFAFFPWKDGLWIFGKGRIEAAGKIGAMYYSYLFHGVVLDPAQLAACGHNPFMFADAFDLSAANRSNLPSLPATVKEKARFLAMQRRLKDFTAAPGAARRDLVLLLQKLENQDPTVPLALKHQSWRDAAYWLLLYFLLPPVLRTGLSFCGWGPAVNTASKLQCLPHGDELTGEGGAYNEVLIRLERAMGHPDEFFRIAGLYERAAGEWERRIQGQESPDNSYLSRMLHAGDRPSVRSVDAWPEVGAGLLPEKIRHMMRVLEVNGDERARFPNLGRDIWYTVYRDYRILSDSEKSRFADPLKQLFRSCEVVHHVDLVADILLHEDPKSSPLPKISAQLWLGLLLHPDVSRQALERAARGLDGDRHGQRRALHVLIGKVLQEDPKDAHLGLYCNRVSLIRKLAPNFFADAVAPMIATPSAGLFCQKFPKITPILVEIWRDYLQSLDDIPAKGPKEEAIRHLAQKRLETLQKYVDKMSRSTSTGSTTPSKKRKHP